MTDKTVLLLGAGAALVVGALLFRNRELFNPLNASNLASQGASAVVADLTGGAAAGGEDSVGGLFARAREYLSGDDARIEAMKRGSPVREDGSRQSVADYYLMGAGA